jgi:N utilization substance protein B
MADGVGPAQRHGAREAALQMLYQWEVGRADLEEVVASYPSTRATPLDPPARALAERLARGTASRLAEIDPLIAEQAEHWRIERMAVIDRLILRLALFELLQGETPRAVVIDEALRLARTFSTEPAVKFVNGILDAVARASSR